MTCRSGNSYALVDVSSGNTLRTAAGQLPAPYTLLDVIVSRGLGRIDTLYPAYNWYQLLLPAMPDDPVMTPVKGGHEGQSASSGLRKQGRNVVPAQQCVAYPRPVCEQCTLIQGITTSRV
jgi:hypothetical protein